MMKDNIYIPEFETAAGKEIQGVNSNGGYLTGYTDATLTEFEAYCKKLSDMGYKQVALNEIKKNKYLTYTKENSILHLTWQGESSLVRIFGCPFGYIPATQPPTYTKVAEPTVTQLKLTEKPGMLYVVQAEDGCFVVVDGGCDKDEDREYLMEYLRTKKPDSHSKPRVTWMITHLHYDHVSLAVKFLEQYKDEIQLDMLTYNFPEVDALTWAHTYEQSQPYAKRIQAWFENINSIYPDTVTFVHHAGQRLLLAGCEIEFLFTQEDWWPGKCQTFNDTGNAFKVKFNSGHDFLCMSDLDQEQSEIMARIYGDYLKCDVLQPNHHGQKGGIKALYEHFKPKQVFWPNTEKKCTTTEGDIYTAVIHHELRSAFNPILFNDENIIGHYHTEQTTIVNMDTLSAVDENGDTARSFWPLAK